MARTQVREISCHPESFSSIPELFKGKCVLVAGATKFLGKVLVEKLLRSCPEIKEVFILLKASTQSRMDKMLNDFREESVFNRQPKDESSLRKIKALAGDIEMDNLGLDEYQYQKVIHDISFVFGCGPYHRLNSTCLDTMNKNLIGVKNILDFCKSCERLEAFVHVSTVYSFSNHFKISEQTYPESVNPQQIMETLRWTTNNQLGALCMNSNIGRRTMHQFSSALAEILITQSESLPVIIVRTSLVTASVKEPFPGWIERGNCATVRVIAMCSTGIQRTLLVKDNVLADCVPVDIVANTLIVAAHYMAVKSKSISSPLKLNAPCRVPIINCTCPENNLITWRKMMEICLPFMIQYPSIQVYGKPSVNVTVHPFQYNLYCWMFHYIPSLLGDFVSCLTLKLPRRVSSYNRVHEINRDFTYFTTQPFFFTSANMRLLMKQMSQTDKELFPIDQSKLDWTAYLENYVLGVRRYMYKNSDRTLPEARMKMMRIYYLWLTYKLFSMLGIFLLIALKCRYRFFPTSLLLIFSYVRSAISYVQRNFVFLNENK